MTNEEMLGVADIVERATNRFNEQAARFRERSAAYDRLIADMSADHERKMAENRAAFGARTEADRQIIEKLRAIVKEQSDHAKDAGTLLGWAPNESAFQAAKRVVKERDGLLTQVQDQRAEIERLQWENKTMHKDAEDGYAEAIKVLGDPIALSKERDALRAEVAQHRKEHDGDQQAIVGLLSERDKLRAEVAALKHEVDTLSCPYVSGQRVRVKSEGGLITQQSEYGIGKIGIINAFAFVARIGSRGWVDVQDIEPCDLPVDHDTPAGKEAAESVIRDSQMTEIKAGTKLRLCKVPMPDPQLSGLVDFPWNAEWGSVGDVAEVINTLNPASLPAVAVRLESELVVWWPRSCIEIVRKVPQ